MPSQPCTALEKDDGEEMDITDEGDDENGPKDVEHEEGEIVDDHHHHTEEESFNDEEHSFNDIDKTEQDIMHEWAPLVRRPPRVLCP